MANNKPTTISFVIDDELNDWLNAKAQSEDRSVSSLLRRIIAEAADREDKKAAKK